MNPVIKAQLADYAKLSALQNYNEDVQFEIYSIFSALNGFLGESVEAYDVHLTGNEFGLDGIAILVQGELVKNKTEAEEKIEIIKNPMIEFIFFQSKTSTSYDYGEVSKFFDAVEGFFEGDLKEESAQVSDLIDAMQVIYQRAIGKRNPRISAFYLATGNYEEPKRIESLKDSFIVNLQEKNIFDSEGIRIGIYGAKQLQKWYRAATTSVEVEVDFPKAVVMPINNNVEEAYVGYINARQLVKLYSVLDSDQNVIGVNKSVFFDNIRDYDPNSKINLEIKESVKNNGGEDFVFRNNGITVVSKNIDRTGDKFRLEDYQIVNGCQTSNIIYDLLYGIDGEDFQHLKLDENINVPFRLIGSKDDEFVASIIVGTNRQNPVKEEQFWALRPFMKSFEEYARSVDSEEVIYFERREHQYRGQNVERVRIIQPSVMMKALAATILFQPHRAGRDYRGIISEYENKLFQEDHDVRIYHAACYLYYRLEFLWRNQRIDGRYRVYRYYIMCAIGMVITQAADVFSMKKAKIEKVSKNIVSLSKNEDKLKLAVLDTISIIDRQLKETTSSSQEKVRDTIRSETFSNAFRDSIKQNSIPNISDYTVQ